MKTTAILTVVLGLLGAAALSTGCSKETKAQGVCPVSGEKLGSMGDPFVIEHKGQKIKLCCEGCKKDFDKDPEKYVSKLAKPAGPDAPK